MNFEDTSQKAAHLVQQYAHQIKNGRQIGSMSISIYDSAWASMVLKDDGGEYQWLFPESFQLLLDSQLQDGGWGSHTSDTDGILNTMAALLALLKHSAATPAINEISCPDLNDKIFRAVSWLETKLQVWDVASADHVGFEMLVPMHLRLLSEHHTFEFPGRKLLMEMYEKKIARFDPGFIYSGKRTTFAHSLEAFIGQMDFNKVKAQLSNGSMMGSPAATAAYLNHSSTWDEGAEAYLKRVFENGAGQGEGGFPSAFPSEAFELSWVVSTLLEAGFTPKKLGESAVNILADHLETLSRKHSGLISFSDGFLPDADDTAKSISVLHMLNRDTGSIGAEKLIEKFWAGRFFQTYTSERNPSLSANCNALKALVALPCAELYASYITSTVNFLCDMWESDGIKDKWNLSPEYSTMLLTQGFMKLLRKCDSSEIKQIPDSLMFYRIPIVLAQALSQTLQSQLPSGSWGAGSCEVTAYAICTLIELQSSPWSNAIQKLITSAISRGREFLSNSNWEDGPKLWIEKVTYKIPNLTRAYCMAALHAPTPSDTWSRIPYGPSEKKVQILPKFFSKLPLFSNHPNAEVKLKVAFVESFPFLQYLRSIKYDVFPENKEKTKEDKYLEYIPYTWTASNAFVKGVYPVLLQDMMVLSMLNYQIDEYMEDFVGKNFKQDLSTVEKIIDEICGLSCEDGTVTGLSTPPERSGVLVNGAKRRRLSAQDISPSNHSLFLTPEDTPSQSASPSLVSELRATLTRYINHILKHPSVLRCPTSIQSHLAADVSQFLKAHVRQIRQNIDFNTGSGIKYTGNETFHAWVRGTGSIHTSCPMSFGFFCCLISQEQSYCLRTPMQMYLANDVRLHLATMCRIYNDCGSIRRDREEGNLNSADFPEFIDAGSDRVNNDMEATENSRKTRELLEIGGYERERMLSAFEKLKSGLDGSVRNALELFVNVTDLYGQIYVARDIGVATGKQS